MKTPTTLERISYKGKQAIAAITMTVSGLISACQQPPAPPRAANKPPLNAKAKATPSPTPQNCKYREDNVLACYNTVIVNTGATPNPTNRCNTSTTEVGWTRGEITKVADQFIETSYEREKPQGKPKVGAVKCEYPHDGSENPKLTYYKYNGSEWVPVQER